MKKTLFTFLLSAICGMVSAQTLTIPNIQILQGGKASFSLVVNVGDKVVTGFQYEKLNLPTGLSVTGIGTPNSEWDATAAVMTSGTKGSSTSLAGKTIPQKEIAIATIEIEAANSLALGEYTVSFPAGDFNFLDGKNYFPIASEVTFKVNVVDAIVLSENSTTEPQPASNVKVKVLRTIKGGKWSTICLPFDMTAAQVKQAFGDGVKLGDFVKYTVKESESKDIVGITIQFDEVDDIVANRPCIINVPSEIKEFTVEGVTIAPEEAFAEYNNGKTGTRKEVYGTFYGTYVANTPVPAKDLFLSDGKFWYATSSTKQMKAFRGYFDFVDILTAAESASSRINITFDDVTAIKSIKTSNSEDIYTLSGQRVKNAGKGVYIVNGKKVIKK